jgi:hypothetical protein
MPQSEAQAPGPLDLGYRFSVTVPSDTGVVVVATPAYLAARGIAYTPGRVPGVTEIRLEPGRYRVGWEHEYDRVASDGPALLEVEDGVVVVGCPSRIWAGAGAEAWFAWLLATDFFRTPDGCVVVDPAPPGPHPRLHLALRHDVD